MRFLLWKSQMSFRELKQKVVKRKQNSSIFSSEISLSFWLFWRFLLIHSIGPIEVAYTAGGSPRFHKPHCLIIGICYSRTQRIRFVGFAFYDYLFTLFLFLFFTGIYLAGGSWLDTIVFGLVFYFVLQFIGYTRATQLFSDIKSYWGFDYHW